MYYSNKSLAYCGIKIVLLILDSKSALKERPKLQKRQSSKNFVKDLPHAFEKNFVFKILCEHDQVRILHCLGAQKCNFRNNAFDVCSGIGNWQLLNIVILRWIFCYSVPLQHRHFALHPRRFNREGRGEKDILVIVRKKAYLPFVVQ